LFIKNYNDITLILHSIIVQLKNQHFCLNNIIFYIYLTQVRSSLNNIIDIYIIELPNIPTMITMLGQKFRSWTKIYRTGNEPLSFDQDLLWKVNERSWRSWQQN